MQIDPSKVQWDAAPAIDPGKVKWDEVTGVPDVGVSGIPGPRRTWGQTAVEAVTNVPKSGFEFLKGLYSAVTSPVQTVSGLMDVAAGGLKNITPKAVKDFIDLFETDPDAAKRAVDSANAFGGFYKDRYGSIDSLKNTLATDPVGAAADLSTLLTAGSTATTRVAPTTAKVLGSASRIVDPLTYPMKAVGAGMRATAAGTGNVIDYLSGQRPEIRAGEILRQAVTEEGRRPSNLTVTRNALIQAEPGLTGRQALAPVQAPQAQALGLLMEERAPGIAAITEESGRAARQGMLTGVTPNEAAAMAARTRATEPFYAQARQIEISVSPELQGLIDRMPKAVLNKAAELARIEDRPFIIEPAKTPPIVSITGQALTAPAPAKVTGETLHYIKRGLDDILSATGEKALTKDMRRSVAGLKSQYLAEVEKNIPVYGQARAKFAELSPEVNQAQVLNKLREVLEAPLGGPERATAFANVLGKGQEALLKKSTGYARYSELSDVLSPEQLKAVSAVKSELSREADIAEQAVRGRRALDAIMEANRYGFRLPGLFSAKIQITNDTLDFLQGRLNKDVLAALEKGFASGKDLNTLLGKVPAKDRIEVLRALGQSSTQLSSAKPTAAAQYQSFEQQRRTNALAPEFQPQNMLAFP